MNNKILITIAARGGSKGVKDKNIRPLAGVPLIAHTIRQAKEWGRGARIICSTDSEAIAAAARQFGAEVPFTRPAELAGDESGKIDVLRHALKTMEELDGEQYDILVDLDVTSPIRTAADIENAYRMFLDKKPDSVVSVTRCRRNPYFNMLEPQESGFVGLVKFPRQPVRRRQDAPVVYDMNASIYVYDRAFLLNETTKTAISPRSLVSLMDEKSAFDIDSEEDFHFIEYMVKNNIVTL